MELTVLVKELIYHIQEKWLMQLLMINLRIFNEYIVPSVFNEEVCNAVADSIVKIAEKLKV